MTYTLDAVLFLGCAVSLLNFYLSFLRYPLFLLLGGVKEDYHFVSGFPAAGSLLVVLSLAIMPNTSSLFWVGIGCAILDTGGLHWFAVTMAIVAVRGKD